MKTPEPTPSGESDRAYRRKYGPAITLGYTLTAGMIFFTALGYYFDHSFKTEGRWTLCGMFMGLVYGAYEVWKLVQRIQREDKANEGKNSAP